MSVAGRPFAHEDILCGNLYLHLIINKNVTYSVVTPQFRRDMARLLQAEYTMNNGTFSERQNAAVVFENLTANWPHSNKEKIKKKPHREKYQFITDANVDDIIDALDPQNNYRAHIENDDALRVRQHVLECQLTYKGAKTKTPQPMLIWPDWLKGAIIVNTINGCQNRKSLTNCMAAFYHMNATTAEQYLYMHELLPQAIPRTRVSLLVPTSVVPSSASVLGSPIGAVAPSGFESDVMTTSGYTPATLQQQLDPTHGIPVGGTTMATSTGLDAPSGPGLGSNTLVDPPGPGTGSAPLDPPGPGMRTMPSDPPAPMPAPTTGTPGMGTMKPPPPSPSPTPWQPPPAGPMPTAPRPPAYGYGSTVPAGLLEGPPMPSPHGSQLALPGQQPHGAMTPWPGPYPPYGYGWQQPAPAPVVHHHQYNISGGISGGATVSFGAVKKKKGKKKSQDSSDSSTGSDSSGASEKLTAAAIEKIVRERDEALANTIKRDGNRTRSTVQALTTGRPAKPDAMQREHQQAAESVGTVLQFDGALGGSNRGLRTPEFGSSSTPRFPGGGRQQGSSVSFQVPNSANTVRAAPPTDNTQQTPLTVSVPVASSPTSPLEDSAGDSPSREDTSGGTTTPSAAPKSKSTRSWWQFHKRQSGSSGSSVASGSSRGSRGKRIVTKVQKSFRGGSKLVRRSFSGGSKPATQRSPSPTSPTATLQPVSGAPAVETVEHDESVDGSSQGTAFFDAAPGLDGINHARPEDDDDSSNHDPDLDGSPEAAMACAKPTTQDTPEETQWDQDIALGQEKHVVRYGWVGGAPAVASLPVETATIEPSKTVSKQVKLDEAYAASAQAEWDAQDRLSKPAAKKSPTEDALEVDSVSSESTDDGGGKPAAKTSPTEDAFEPEDDISEANSVVPVADSVEPADDDNSSVGSIAPETATNSWFGIRFSIFSPSKPEMSGAELKMIAARAAEAPPESADGASVVPANPDEDSQGNKEKPNEAAQEATAEKESDCDSQSSKCTTEELSPMHGPKVRAGPTPARIRAMTLEEMKAAEEKLEPAVAEPAEEGLHAATTDPTAMSLEEMKDAEPIIEEDEEGSQVGTESTAIAKAAEEELEPAVAKVAKPNTDCSGPKKKTSPMAKGGLLGIGGNPIRGTNIPKAEASVVVETVDEESSEGSYPPVEATDGTIVPVTISIAATDHVPTETASKVEEEDGAPIAKAAEEELEPLDGGTVVEAEPDEEGSQGTQQSDGRAGTWPNDDKPYWGLNRTNGKPCARCRAIPGYCASHMGQAPPGYDAEAQMKRAKAKKKEAQKKKKAAPVMKKKKAPKKTTTSIAVIDAVPAGTGWKRRKSKRTRTDEPDSKSDSSDDDDDA
ncbi:expressed unknown protein [Seminavis robusta]|uniref:Uncharacterized protein n=1 Tax=Seminavis robusta TaxID=568900 RepID=A0A9N8DBD7_9STRA|nr:expressed unknown protein [Seminavis robusta]|eukprot:Sro23_g015550.1 n/a (1357) ;mRNA; f:7313-12240